MAKEKANVLDPVEQTGIKKYKKINQLIDSKSDAEINIQKLLAMSLFCIQNGKYEGFARIYVLATEMVAYTDNKIDGENLKKYLQAYQTKKKLDMEEIWNIGLFLQIAIIKNIAELCEEIYINQIQKYKVKSIIERLVENKNKDELKYNKIEENKLTKYKSMKYPFIEYMTY